MNQRRVRPLVTTVAAPFAVRFVGLCALAATLVLPAVAEAHISIVSGVAAANTTQKVTFGVGHGCAGADTFKVKVTIPAGIASVRPVRSDFGKVSVEKDNTGAITAVIWQKDAGDALDADLAYYELVVRMRVPDMPFTTIYFPAEQTCRAADGTLSVVDWKMLPTDPVGDAGADEPAPALVVLPARQPGWNKWTVKSAVADAAGLTALFADAQIVWKGTAAWSPNPNTTQLISGTPGVTALSSLAANDEIWIKY